MSVWRQKAIECLPENRTEFEDPDTSIYGVFIELLPATIKAHQINDMERLKRLYGFADWCFRQNAKDLWNAAGVSFYEHLYDFKETKESFFKWIKKDIFLDVRCLLELKVDKEEMRKLDQLYK